MSEINSFYYFNKNIDDKGNHEVHMESCSYLPALSNRSLIGIEKDCSSAIQRAKKETGKYNFDGCFFCCRECHTG